MRVPGAVAASLVAIGCARSVAVTPSVTTPGTATPTSPAAAAAGTRGAFVLLRGADTVGVERFARGVDRLPVEFSSSGALAFRYDASVPVFAAGSSGRDGLVATVTFTAADSARLELAGTTPDFRVEPSGGILGASARRRG
jgi:hypothetical protein